MRWKRRGERYVKRFALLPYEIHGDIRWLETVYIRQIYISTVSTKGWWVDRQFVPKCEYDAYKRKLKILKKGVTYEKR